MYNTLLPAGTNIYCYIIHPVPICVAYLLDLSPITHYRPLLTDAVASKHNKEHDRYIFSCYLEYARCPWKGCSRLRVLNLCTHCNKPRILRLMAKIAKMAKICC